MIYALPHTPDRVDPAGCGVRAHKELRAASQCIVCAPVRSSALHTSTYSLWTTPHHPPAYALGRSDEGQPVAESARCEFSLWVLCVGTIWVLEELEGPQPPARTWAPSLGALPA
jgi:hypothetical protein